MNTATVPKIAPHIYAARTANLPASLTLEDWTRTVADFNGLCAYCGKAPARIVEHFIPVRAGGGTTAGNCLPACQGCNRSKSDTHPDDLDNDRIPASRVAALRAYLRARSDGTDTAESGGFSACALRIPQEILDGLDGWVSEMNRDPDRLGNATRGRLVVKILREALEARNRSKSPTTEPQP